MVDLFSLLVVQVVVKQTVSRLIYNHKQELWPIIDYGYLREFHLNHQWTNESDTEEQMTFENLIFILKNYHRYSYKNIPINDLTDKRIEDLSNYLSHDDYNYLIITLIVNDSDVLSIRVLNPERDSG